MPMLLGNTPEMAGMLSCMEQYRAEVDCAYPQALTYQEQALAMREALYLEQGHPDIAVSLNNAGSAYQPLGDVKKVLEYKI